MYYTLLTPKEVEKQNKELIELHKRCIKSYLIQHSMKVSKRKKFFYIYDFYVDHRNINGYFFIPIGLFVRYLILGKLDDICIYIQKYEPKKKKRRSKVSKKSK